MIIGLDVGGTHTDVVLVGEEGLNNTVKVPTDRDNLFASVLNGLEEVSRGIPPEKIRRIVLSTTLTTNAIAENKINPVALVVSSGPGINPDFFRIGNYYYRVSGSIDHRGREIQPIDPSEVEAVAAKIRSEGLKAVGVVGKFSIRNPSHENQIVKIVKNSSTSCIDYILAGHRVSGNLNFPRRIATVYINAAVHAIHRDFFRAVVESLKAKGLKTPIYILKADGGTMSLKASLKFPGQTILSGPASSVMGAVPYANAETESVVLDIGGTTTDIAVLVKGVPLLEPLGIELGGYKTLIRALRTRSIPVGGDSQVNVVGGRIIIGPERKGPAMAFGGPVPTPTDALVFMGLMQQGNKLRAEEAVKSVADKLNISPSEAAASIYDAFCRAIVLAVNEMIEDINSRPFYTVHEYFEDYRIRPREILALGGPAPFVADGISSRSGLPVRVVPVCDVANALGAALARTTCEVTLFVDTERGVASAPEEGFYKPVDSRFSLDDARKLAFSVLKTKALSEGAREGDLEMEVVEEQQFNMVRGFYTTGRNIRVKVQVKPGLMEYYRMITEKISSTHRIYGVGI
ncbi:hydantoinase/oxoprolinase family protein [Thermodesulforhabdus norvegica]|uniref:N-methylhydantoinase A/oxoprolinase/acetone carboxylase, beta subunit n=1 Tax=Thermodesulforhabdus norvegica TaxID=39841 RepID=A0A1I4UA17_9BACT|nr:hydantoinase/oxoprolinase family protein [Thermodesulforhabdus norvegica]SFM85650.1 N-methylhydantoinase A/oxoprolinase/acetone carboxylase, beta subunit [Thermodesulforhabdus norvegica]